MDDAGFYTAMGTVQERYNLDDDEIMRVMADDIAGALARSASLEDWDVVETDLRDLGFPC